jgi:tRNA(fMet)-specific endonuclease VapC
MYLLDTNTCIQYLRKRSSSVVQRIHSTAAADIRLCSVVRAELLTGALRSARPAANRARVDAFVQQFVSLPFDDAAAEAYAQIRAHLESQGRPISIHDMLIAAIGLVHNLTVVTHNSAEFGRVPGLVIEDWEVP